MTDNGLFDSASDILHKNKFFLMGSLEHKLFTVFSVITERQRINLYFGLILIITSFIQTTGYVIMRERTNKDDVFLSDVMSVIKVFQIFKLTVDLNNGFAFFFIAYSFFAISTVYFAMLFVVYYVGTAKKNSCSIIVSTVCMLTPILYWIFVTPLVKFFVSIFSCNAANRFTYAPSVECWSVQHIIHTVLFSVLFSIYFIVIFLITLFGNDRNPYNKLNPFTRFEWSFEILYTLSRIYLSVDTIYATNTVFHYIGTGLIFLLCLYFILIVRPNCLYYHMYTRFVFSVCIIGFSWVSYASIVAELTYAAGYKCNGRILLCLIALPILLMSAVTIESNNIESLVLENNLSNIRNKVQSERYIHYLNSIRNLNEQNLLTENESIMLLGYTCLHTYECIRPNCPMSNAISCYIPLTKQSSTNGNKQLSDSVRLRHLLYLVYHYKINNNLEKRPSRLNPSAVGFNFDLIIPSAYYQIFVIGNHFRAGFLLDDLLEIDNSFMNREAVYKAKRILRQKHNERNSADKSVAKERGTPDISELLKTEDRMTKLKKELIMLSDGQKRLCSELLLPRLDLNKLYAIGGEVFMGCQLVTKEWNEILASDYVDKKTIAMYKLYMIYLRGKQEDSILINRKIRNEQDYGEDVDANEKPANHSEVTAIIGISAKSNSLGKIIKASNGVIGLFDYSPSDVIGKNITVFMPAFIAKDHSSYISKYLDSGRGNIVNKKVKVFASNKENYIFGITIYVREYYDIEYGTYFLGLLKPSTEDKGIIVTNLKGQILGISHEVFLCMNELNPVLLAEQKVLLSQICPDITIQLAKADYETFEGTLTLAFHVSKNLQAAFAMSSSQNLHDFSISPKNKPTVERSDYDEQVSFIRSCTIATQEFARGATKIKVITFSKADDKVENINKLQHNKDISDILIPAVYTSTEEIESESNFIIDITDQNEDKKDADGSSINAGEHMTDYDDRKEKDKLIAGYKMLNKELIRLRTTGFDNYMPKHLFYSHVIVFIFCLVIITTVVTSYIIHKLKSDEITTLISLTTHMQVKKAVFIYESLKSYSLTYGDGTTGPMLDPAKRNYNYSSIDNLASSSLGYAQWKQNEFLEATSVLFQCIDFIHTTYIGFPLGRDMILFKDVNWTYAITENWVMQKHMNVYTLLEVMMTQIMKIYSYSQSNVAKMHSELSLLSLQWYNSTLPTLQSLEGVGSISINNLTSSGNLIMLSQVIIISIVCIFCIAGITPILYYTRSDVSNMLKLIAKIKETDLRWHIEGFVHFTNLINFEFDVNHKNRDYRHDSSTDNLENKEEDQSLLNSHSAEDEVKTNVPHKNKAHSKHKLVTEFRGNFWFDFFTVCFVLLIFVAYGLYKYFAESRFFDKIACHVYELDLFSYLLVKDEILYISTVDVIGTKLPIYQNMDILGIVKNATNLLTEISEIHKKQSWCYTSKLNNEFNEFYYYDVCTSTTIRNVTECQTINDAILTNGLFLTNKLYIDNLYQTILTFISMPPENITTTLSHHLLNSNDFITTEIVWKKYLLISYIYLYEKIQESLNTTINDNGLVAAIFIALFIAFIVLLYLIGWRMFVNSMSFRLFSSKLLISYMPLSMIIDNAKLIEALNTYVNVFLTEIKNI